MSILGPLFGSNSLQVVSVSRVCCTCTGSLFIMSFVYMQSTHCFRIISFWHFPIWTSLACRGVWHVSSRFNLQYCYVKHHTSIGEWGQKAFRDCDVRSVAAMITDCDVRFAHPLAKKNDTSITNPDRNDKMGGFNMLQQNINLLTSIKPQQS